MDRETRFQTIVFLVECMREGTLATKFNCDHCRYTTSMGNTSFSCEWRFVLTAHS